MALHAPNNGGLEDTEFCCNQVDCRHNASRESKLAVSEVLILVEENQLPIQLPLCATSSGNCLTHKLSLHKASNPNILPDHNHLSVEKRRMKLGAFSTHLLALVEAVERVLLETGVQRRSAIVLGKEPALPLPLLRLHFLLVLLAQDAGPCVAHGTGQVG